MTSKLAECDIEQLKAEGLEPTVRDIIRLNALALKYEIAKGMRPNDDIYSLPRAAYINDSVCFRQPTVGHDIWFDKVSRFIDIDDYSTTLALNAYMLSRDWRDLADANDVAKVNEEVNKYAEQLKDITQEQLFHAIVYVKKGIDALTDELPADKIQTDEQKQQEAEDYEAEVDWNTCIALGTLNRGKAVLWGISAADMKDMTHRELIATIDKAYVFHDIDVKNIAKDSLGQYYRTLDNIKLRLIDEKDKKEHSK